MDVTAAIDRPNIKVTRCGVSNLAYFGLCYAGLGPAINRSANDSQLVSGFLR